MEDRASEMADGRWQMADGRPKIEARSPKLLLQGRIRESLVLRRSDVFQTGLPCSTVARCPPSHPRALSRFGNRRSAKDSRMRPTTRMPRPSAMPVVKLVQMESASHERLRRCRLATVGGL